MQSNDSNDNTNGNNDINNNHEELNKLPENIIEKLQANAFRNLCLHLQERSDLVTNIDLMTISGFCRNCLAKVRHVCMQFFSFLFWLILPHIFYRKYKEPIVELLVPPHPFHLLL